MALRTQDAISSATNFFQEHGFICSCGYNGPTPARAGQPSPAQHEPCLTHQPITGAPISPSYRSVPTLDQHEPHIIFQPHISTSTTSGSNPISFIPSISSGLTSAWGQHPCRHLPLPRSCQCSLWVGTRVGTRPDTYMVISHYPLSPSYPGFTLPEEVATTHMCPYTLYACMW